jgi:hypothetical protein
LAFVSLKITEKSSNRKLSAIIYKNPCERAFVILRDFGYTVLPPINLKRMEITANTNNIWIRPPKLYTKNPKIHPMINMIAIKYNNELMAFRVMLNNWF